MAKFIFTTNGQFVNIEHIMLVDPTYEGVTTLTLIDGSKVVSREPSLEVMRHIEDASLSEHWLAD